MSRALPIVSLLVTVPLLGLLAHGAAPQLQNPRAPRRIDLIDFEGMPAGTLLHELFGRAGTGPIFNGMVAGDFRIDSGSSKSGGSFCEEGS